MDTISLNPVKPAPVQKSGGGKTTLYIVVFFLCVISAMAGTFYFMMGQKDAAAAKQLSDLKKKAESDMAAAKSEQEKREIARKAEIEAERVKMQAKAKAKDEVLKAREEQLKRAEARVNSELDKAAKKVREADELKRDAGNKRTEALKRLAEAKEAMKKAEETNDANLKKLAEEKKRIAADAARKVKAADQKAAQARAQAAAQAKKATDLNKRLGQVSAKLRGKTWEYASKYGGVPGYAGGYWKELGKNSNPWVCAAWARANGAHMWGHRGINHPDKKYKNTCWAYKPGFRPKFKGNDDDVHLTGCAFGGHPSKGCAYYPQVRMGYHTYLRGPRWQWNGGNRDIGYVGNYWNDKISSIYVPSNTWLAVYEHGNYRGRGWGIRGPRYVPKIGWWNDRISSVRIRHF
jgi:actin-related protein